MKYKKLHIKDEIAVDWKTDHQENHCFFITSLFWWPFLTGSIHANLSILCVWDIFGKRNSDVYYTLPNYEIVRHDRRHSNGGGLLCYLHSNVSSTVIQSVDCKNVECVILKIMPTGARPFIVSFVYRPPSSVINWETEFNDILSQCESICNEIIIMGDFNINLLDTKLKTKWDNKFCKPNSLSQMIKKATRVAEKSATHIYNKMLHVYNCRKKRTS